MGSETKIKIFSDVALVKIGAIKKNPWNPNSMAPLEMESLREGIKREGFLDPILVQRSTGAIIDGEHRWKCAKTLKMPLVPVIYLDVDDHQARKLTTAIMFRRGKADDAALAALVQEIQSVEKAPLADLERELAISQDQLEELLKNASDTEKDFADAAKNGKKAAKAAKESGGEIDADPDAPDGKDFEEGDEVEGEEDEAHRFPVTFFAPDLDARARVKALLYDEKAEEFSFAELTKMVDFYLEKHPKRKALAEIKISSGKK